MGYTTYTMYYNNSCDIIKRKKWKREEANKEDELREIEDMICVLLSLQNKRRRVKANDKSRPYRVGMKYEKNTLYFTDPE